MMLTREDGARIAQAVAEAEAGTAGEIVTVLTPRSDSYTDVALAWSVFVAFLALAALEAAPAFAIALVDRALGLWASEWGPRAYFGLALTVAVIKFAAMLAILQWRRLRLWLTPTPVKRARVHARALTAFRLGAESRTTGRTGVVIYVSLDERKAEIIADRAVADRVDPEVWGAAMVALLAPLRDGRLADGMVAAIAQVGAVLAQHAPRLADDVNELPDGPILL
jgi:putative membrane protein